MKTVFKIAVTLLSLIVACSCEKEPVVTSIGLDQTQLDLYVGDTYYLKVSHYSPEAPAPKYTWKSWDSSVAKVTESGGVIALKKGTTEITVSAGYNEDGQILEARCTVNVLDIDIESFTLSASELNLDVNEEVTLEYSITPDAASYHEVVWSSSDEAVATVSNQGLVRAHGSGEAIITATAGDTGISASCKIIVGPVIATGVKITNASSNMNINTTQTLSYEFTPAFAAPVKMNWTSSDESIITVNEEGVCTALAEGVAVITLSSEDQTLKDEIEITVKDPYLKVGRAYVSKWGYECTVNEVDLITEGSKMSCRVNYTIKNITTDKELTECTFCCVTESGETEGQYGFFGSLFPDESKTRSYTFETLASDPFVELRFVNPFDNEVVNPDADDLVWYLNQIVSE